MLTLYINSRHPAVFLLIYLKYIPVKIQIHCILSIMHVATCFDSLSDHQANHSTISEVHKVTVHILGSPKVYKGDHY